MNHKIIDLEGLLPQVWGINSKAALTEAISAYKAGAYRSAIIATWLAVLTDVLDKVIEIAAIEGGQAQNIKSKLDAALAAKDKNTAVKLMRELEDSILNIAKDDLQLISQVEYLHLERLKEDRNLCAHPSFSSVTDKTYNPEPDACRLYIIQVWQYLLSYPPVLGKKYCDGLLAQVASKSFPVDKEQAYKVLSTSTVLGFIKKSALRSFIDALIKGVLINGAVDEPTRLKYLSALLASSRVDPQTFDNEFVKLINKVMQHKDAEPLWVAQILGGLDRQYILSPGDWTLVQGALEEGLLVLEKQETPESYLLNAERMRVFSHLPVCAARYVEAGKSLKNIFSKLKNYPKLKIDLFKLWEDCPSIREEFVEYFGNCPSFYSTDNAMPVLRAYAKHLDAGGLQKLLELIEDNGNKYGPGSSKINQILESGNEGEVFTILYKDAPFKEIWQNYLNIKIGLQVAHNRSYLHDILKEEKLFNQGLIVT